MLQKQYSDIQFFDQTARCLVTIWHINYDVEIKSYMHQNELKYNEKGNMQLLST